MENLLGSKFSFLALSGISLVGLISAFAFPLQKLEVWRQTEIGGFKHEYHRTFLLTENSSDYPFGFDVSRAVRIGYLYRDYKVEKISLVIVSIVCSGLALYQGNKIIDSVELDSELVGIKRAGRKELLTREIKHRMAMASKSQQLLFLDEMKAMLAEFGSPESEMIDADELNALYEGSETVESDVPNFRTLFPEEMDKTSLKACQKALESGSSKDDVVRDVLGCNDSQHALGIAYLDYLIQGEK